LNLAISEFGAPQQISTVSRLGFVKAKFH